VGASQEPRRVVDGPSRWMWSSTGAELAAIRLRSPVSNIASTLTTIDPATGETTSAVSIPERVGDVTSGPAWSPDGTRLVFGTGDGAIYSIDVRSGASSLLVRPPAEHLGEDVFQIVWSPDGAHIGFATTGGVYVMDAQGSNVRVLQDKYSPAGVAWSPDGTRLAYQDDEEGVIWAAPTDASAPTEIGRPLPSSCYLLCPAELIWSPDGTQIAFRLIWIRDGGDVSVEVSALDADGRGEAERIDELTYQSWDGGSYSGEYAWF
jgi:Tol biopolymer transport system component